MYENTFSAPEGFTGRNETEIGKRLARKINAFRT